MVLVQSKYTHLLIPIFVALTLNACSHLGSQKQNNRSPNSPIIPVKTDQATINPAPSIDNTKQVSDKSSQQKTQTVNSEAINSIKKKQHSTSDVLASVINSAKKAISMQQWLRAQHQLEHALRIAPKDAQVFLLYAEVYEGLDIKEQQINMLKRALFLAQPESEIYVIAKEKLADNE